MAENVSRMSPASSQYSPSLIPTATPSTTSRTVTPTQALLATVPDSLLSSSPGASPKIIDPPPRVRSIKPRMVSENGDMASRFGEPGFMHHGIPAGADFFDSGSSADEYGGEEVGNGRGGEEGDWEDDEGGDGETASSFSSAGGFRGRHRRVWSEETAESAMDYERDGDRQVIGELWPFTQIPTHDSGTGTSGQSGEDGDDFQQHTEEDQERGRKGSGSQTSTPRGSISLPGRHDSSEDGDAAETDQLGISMPKTNPNHWLFPLSSNPAVPPKSPRHQTHPHPPHINIAPVDPDRPPHLPAHFVKTPYPFTPHKEFPKPQTRPRQRHHGHSNHKAKQVFGLEPSASDQWSVKGKQVLGMVASDGEVEWGSGRGRWSANYSLRGRPRTRGRGHRDSGLYMDEGDSLDWGKGLTRSQSESRGAGGPQVGRRSGADNVSLMDFLRGGPGVEEEQKEDGTQQEAESVVLFLCLRPRHGRPSQDSPKMERIAIPRELTTTSPAKSSWKAWPRKPSSGSEKDDKAKEKEREKAEKLREKALASQHERAFDDQFLAERMRVAYSNLTGSWFRRALSARTLKCIQLSRDSVWSGDSDYPLQPQDSPRTTTSGLLLAVRGALDLYASPAESMGSPAMGERSEGEGGEFDVRSKFTEQALLELYHRPREGKGRYAWVHWARRVASANHVAPSPQSSNANWKKGGRERERQAVALPGSLLTIQFVHSFSLRRILLALAVIVAIAIAAPLLWIFLGQTSGGDGLRGHGRGDRVGAGVAVGVLVLVVEMVGFGGWVWVSCIAM